MGKIHVLDDHVANQIAAGEVVERPSSVVKELVENSVDAGSTRIEVTVEEGGLQSIRIKDNGSGIETEDCLVAFERHATSKIQHGRDLFHIRSLGFRGEALPSIAAVAKVSCLSATDTGGLGKLVVMEGGKLVKAEEAAADKGTDMLVKDLFYNTPARLKYMKTIQTELGHISDYIYRLALAHPEIAFTLKHNGNVMLQTIGNGDALQVIAAVYGTSAAKSMLKVEGSNSDYKLEGYVSLPEMTRANRGSMTMIVNGRYIRSYALQNAVLQAYHTLLPINRYPVVLLNVEMDPSLVDVNVHPAKLEVRFSKETELVHMVSAQIREVLQSQVLIPSAAKPQPKSHSVIQEQIRFYPDSARKAEQGTTTAEGMSDIKGSAPQSSANSSDRPRDQYAFPQDMAVRKENEGLAPLQARQQLQPQTPLRPSIRSTFGAAAGNPPTAVGNRHAGTSGRTARMDDQRSKLSSNQGWSSNLLNGMAQNDNESRVEPSSSALASFPKLYPIGQLHGTYIVAQNEDGLFLIDQHAAHERINYEYYFEKFGKPVSASQELLLPLTLEFTPSEAEFLKNRLNLFERVGVHIEHFGGNGFLVRSIPEWMPKGDEHEILQDMAEWVLSEKQALDIAKLREKAAILCSCKASIKANDSMTTTGIEALLDRLAACGNPYTCPHGRPIVISFSTYELEKLFKRVM